MARQRYVYPTDRIPHLWAHQTQSSARNPQKNLYFEGDTIYSYGRHFPIARIIEYNNRKMVLFNVSKDSSTTAQHQHAVRRACNHLLILDTDDPNWGTIGAETYAEKQVRDALCELTKAKSKPSKAVKYSEYFHAVSKYKHTRAILGLDCKPELLALDGNEEYERITAEHNAKVEERKKKKEEKARIWWEERNKQYDKERSMTPEERIAHWRAGGNFIRNMDTLNSIPTMLRISKNGEEVETSLGAAFPLDHARKALPLVKVCLEHNSTYAKPESSDDIQIMRLGHYTVDRIENGKLYAGCHVIEREEVEHFAKLLSEFRQEGV